jgi:YspA, cpYpsA-related SLOG family
MACPRGRRDQLRKAEPMTDSEQQLKRILITGSRDWTDAETIRAAIRQAALRQPDAIVVHGAARGADLLASAAARALGLREERHPAQWQKLGKVAGPVRNQEMVRLGADVCLAFIKDGSRGASHCAALAEKAGIPVHRYVSGTVRDRPYSSEDENPGRVTDAT